MTVCSKCRVISTGVLILQGYAIELDERSIRAGQNDLACIIFGLYSQPIRFSGRH